MRFRLAAFALLAGLAFTGTSISQDEPPPHWIWHQVDEGSTLPQGTETIYLRRAFKIPGKLESAELKIAADDKATVFINGKSLSETPVTVRKKPEEEGPNYRAENHDLARLGLLVPGKNVIAVEASNRGGPAGFLMYLSIVTEDGQSLRLISDAASGQWLTAQAVPPIEDWETVGFDHSSWKPAKSLGVEGDNPWFEVLTPPSVASGDSLKLPPGFKAEILRIAKADEDTWVSMCVDDKGRLIVSAQHPIEGNERWGGLIRFTLDEGNGQILEEERIELPVGSAQGMDYGHGALYLNGLGPEGLGMYRVTDSDGDDQLDKVEFLKQVHNRGGSHGPHGVAVGPDGWIYHISGDYSKPVEGLDPDSPYQNYLEDLLLPRHWDATGHGRGIMAPSGHVQRFTPDGKVWQLYCGGMRNPYDLAFNIDGDLFTYDADMEYDLGLPWYRPTRVYQLIPGGEYGQRAGTGKWPFYYPDSLPPVAEVGLGSPCGVKFSHRSHFPREYKLSSDYVTLFLCDWAWGKIYSLRLNRKRKLSDPRGYSPKVFAEGRPLNAMDIEFAGDGSMYLITGGNDSRAALYRIWYEGDKNRTVPAPRPNDPPPADATEELRYKISSQTLIKDIETAFFAGVPALRMEMRLALEKLPVDDWWPIAKTHHTPEVLINTALALARVGGPEYLTEILDALKRASLSDTETYTGEKLELLRTYQVAFARLGPPDLETRTRLAKKFDALYPARDYHGSDTFDVNRELSQLLVYLEAPAVIEKSLALMEAATRQEEDIWFAFVLRTLPASAGWTIEQRKRYLAWYDHAAANYSGGASFYKYLANFKQDALATLTAEERAHPDLAPFLENFVMPAPLAPTKAMTHVKAWTMADLEPLLGEVARGKGRDFDQGKAAFRNAQCAICHRVFGEGGAIGPDLTAVGSRFSLRDILEAIIDPHKTVMAQYENTTVTRKDGTEVVGRLIDENADRIVLITDAITQARTEVAASDAAERAVSKVSPMPPALLDVLTEGEILDLLAYLQSGGTSGAAVFK